MVRCYLGSGFSQSTEEKGLVNSPGSRLNFRHRTMRVHMNDPRMRLERQAADIAVEATIISLRVQSIRVKHERDE